MIFLFLVNATALADSPENRGTRKNDYPADSLGISSSISRLSPKLNYPNLVKQFYGKRNFSLAWVRPDTVKTEIYKSMLLMDCVLQFGLNRADFHPEYLTYDRLRPLVQKNAPIESKVNYDVYLTDALITLINHLHYGKFNPVYARQVLESGKRPLAFDPVQHLSGALKSKSFMEAVVSAQPATEMYRLLQDYLHLVKGQYIDDCYEFPEGDARRIAINMERLRWVNSGNRYFIQINIPAFTLKVIHADSISVFRTIVGNPSTPTPELESTINYMTTAPEWKVPAKIFSRELLPKALRDSGFLANNQYNIYDQKGNLIAASRKNLLEIARYPNRYSARQSPGCDNALGRIVFRFPNRFDIYLHDTPDQKLFKKDLRSFSHGCVRVEDAGKLAALLLKYDGSPEKVPSLDLSMAKLKRKTFGLNRPVPVMITYRTCEIVDGIFTSYPDIYKRDAVLEGLMFPVTQKLAGKIK